MAELKLRVSLDTSYLKGQISRLPLEFAGANVSIRPKFDKQTIVNEFRLLNRYISSKKFNIVINTNLEAEIKNADRLVKALGRVQQAASGAKGGLPIGTQVLSRTKSKGGFAAAEIKTLFGAAVQGGLIDEKTLAATRAQMVAALGSIGRDSIAGLLNGLKSGDADIQNAAKFLGNNLITSFKTVLGIASPSREFKKIGESAGQGFEQGLLKSIEIAEQSATRKMQRMLDRLARMALMMGGISGPEIGRQVAQARGLPALNFGATTPRASVGIGPSSSGRMLPAAPSRTAIAGAPAPAGLLPSLSSAGQSKAIIEALIASTGPRLLPSGGGDNSLGKLAAPRQTKDAVDAILRNYFKVVETQVKEVFSAPPIKKESLNIFDHLNTEQYFNYLAQARVNAENAIKQRIEEAKQVTKQNQIKDAAQSFLRALEETVRNAERSAFTQSRIAANASYVQRANVREIGQPLLGGRQGAAPKMLSAATGFYRGASASPPLPETQSQLFARREREARMRSALRGVDVLGETSTRGPAPYSRAYRASPSSVSAMVPYAAGGAIVPIGGGGGGTPPMPPRGGGGGSFGGMQFNMPKLPGAGLVREIGEEFGFAAKQVLLFGTAYKALAFIQGFPAQVGAAVGALQSFRNTIKAISPTAEEAAASSQFILDVVDKYNTPIQSARDGFTKLYASMKPTGFSGNEIRDLFLGISQAAATFGMSAEKVDRVSYAFAQMASKGQVMSEELKGQLGDVLPGAMGIFAEAAGFEGPDALTKFSKALEDGAYKGAAMKTLLTNVGVIMRKEFGPGAEGAARTFQGVINRMQNSFKLLYESFEPVAVGFLNSAVMPITAGIKTLTDGFNAFFTGTLARTEGGAVLAQQLNNLKPSFEGIRANLTALIPSFQTFGQLLLSVAQFLTQLAGNPITGFLLKVYTNVLLVNTAFTLLGGRILLGLIANVNAAIIRFVAFGYAINAVGIQTTGANTALAGTQLQMMLLQRSAGAALAPVNALLGSLARIAAIGTIAVVLTIAISNMNEFRDAEARLNRLRGAKADSVVGPTGPRPIQTAQARFAGASRETIEEARGKQTKYLTDLTLKRQALERKLQSAQGENLAAMADANSASITTAGNRLAVAQANFNSINKDIENAQEVLRLDPRNYRRQAEINRSSTPGISATSGGGGGTAAGGTKPKQERESQVPLLKLELQYQKELLPLGSEINRARLLDDNLAVIRLENEKNMLDLKYEALRVNLEDIPVAEKRLKIETLQSKGQMAALKTRYDIEFEIAKILEEHDKTLESMEDKSNLELLNRKSYIELLLNGIKPAHAKITIEVENEIAALTKSLELRRQNLEEEIKLLQAKKAGGGKIDEDRLTELQLGLEKTRQRIADLPVFGTGETARRLAIAEAPKLSQEYTAEGLGSAQDRLAELTNTGYQVVQAANAIGEAFGEAFKGLITGSMTAQEALAGMFQSIADHFADMVAQMIAEYLKMALIKGIMALIGGVTGGLGGGLSSGFNAGTSSAIDTGAAGWASSFATPLKFANGGIASGGFQAFANGGIVTGPTLGLVGEGRYNEAVIPLPDGKSVPVDLGGAMGSQITSNIVVNVSSDGKTSSSGSGSDSAGLGRKIEGAVKQVIVGELRPGGLLASR